MAVQGLPSADSLLASIATLQRRLTTEETGFRNTVLPTAASADNRVSAIANGMVEMLSVSIVATAWPATSAAAITSLAASIKDACGKAVTAANANTKPKAAADAPGYTLTGIPNSNQAPPVNPTFSSSDADLTARLRAQDPIISAQQFQGISGSVSAIVDGGLNLISITLTGPLPALRPVFENDVMVALNIALDKAKNLFEDGIKTRVDGGVDSSAVTFPVACLWAQGNMAIGDRVQVKKQDGTFAPVVNAGSTGTNIGSNAKTGDVWSRAAVQVRSNGTVNGNMRTMSSLDLQSGASVTGTTTSNGALLQIPMLGRTVTFQTPDHTNQTVPDPNNNNNKTLDLAPGRYPDVTVNNTGILILHAGTYFFNNWTVNSGGKISCVSAGVGQVQVNVQNNFIFRGQINELNKPTTRPNLFVGVLGANTIPVEGPFTGTLMALNAQITLATTHLTPPVNHTGAFYAKNIQVDPDNTIVHFPFSGPPTPTST